MRVALVDDEIMERDRLHGYLRQFETENNMKFEIEEFATGDSFLEGFQIGYDIVIFDVDMPGLNGLDCARAIRETDSDVMILFVTNMAQYAVKGYEVDAVDYIIKPVSYYDFSMKFQKTVRRASRKQEKSIALKAGSVTHHMKISDICYVEVLAHNVIYHQKGSTVKLRGSMKEQETLLCAYGFCRVHKSYLVNLARVENIHGSTIVVCGEEVPIGYAYKDAVMQKFFQYLRT